MNPIQLLSEKAVYENAYFTILDRHYLLPHGKDHHFFVRKEVDTCCVLAMTTEGHFIVIKEFRAGPQEVLVELPAGRFEGHDDNPDERIKKELLEETGYSGKLKKVGVMPTSPYSTRHIHCYYATECVKVSEQKLDHSESIEVELVSPKEMKKILMTGASSSCAPGLLAWEWMKQDGIL